MPLKKSGSSEALRSNIQEMIKSGYKPKQAIAASLTNQRKYKKMYEGGMVPPEGDIDDSVDGMVGKPTYPEVDAGESLSENVEQVNRALADALEQSRYSANQEGTLVSEPDMEVMGESMADGAREPISGDETPEVMHDGTKEPMRTKPMKEAELDHAMIGGVPAGPMLSVEAMEAIKKKKSNRRLF